MTNKSTIEELKDYINILENKLEKIELSYQSIKNNEDRLADPDKMRELRLRTGLNHEDFGKLIGVSRSYIYQIEKSGNVGKNRHSNLSKHFEMAANLASIFECQQPSA